MSVTKPALDRLPARVSMLALVLLALAASSCASKSNPVLPSTGGPSGMVAGGSDDGGEIVDTQVTVQEDVADAAVGNVSCDLLTYIRTGKGCPAAMACYPVSGTGKCLPVGNQGVLSPCTPNDATGTFTCAEGLACFSDPDMGPVCFFLCDTSQSACTGGNVCVPFGTTGAGSCQLLPS